MTFGEHYFNTKLSGSTFGKWSEMLPESREFVLNSLEFKKWKLKESIKNIVRAKSKRLTDD